MNEPEVNAVCVQKPCKPCGREDLGDVLEQLPPLREDTEYYARLKELKAAVESVAGSLEAAEKSAAAAKGSADEAAGSAEKIKDWANLSKSYAVGEGAPEQHPGESTDNARYYAGQAKDSAGSAAESASAAKASEGNAESSKTAAGNSERNAADSAGRADADAKAAADSAGAAADAALRAGNSEASAAQSQEAAERSAAAAGTSEANAAKSEQAAENWANLSKSYAVGEGAPEQHENEETDNAKYYAGQAKNSAASAAGSVAVIEENAGVLKEVQENLAAIQGAAGNALRAEASAEGASDDALRAEAASEDANAAAELAEQIAKQVQSVVQGQKGWYPDEDELRAAHPTGQNGDWAFVGTTDTIWTWDSDTGQWVNTHKTCDMSNYYTKQEADEKQNELQEALGKQIAAATSRAWTVEVPASAWAAGTYTATYGGVSFACTQKATVSAAGMAADTALGLPEFAGGDLTAAQTWAVAVPGADTVTFWSETKPTANFTVRLVEVK